MLEYVSTTWSPLQKKPVTVLEHIFIKFSHISSYHYTSADVSEMGSVVNCEMLHRTNLIAIVGGGSRPKFADNSILIYDDVLKEFVLDYTFTSPVVAVRLKRDRQDSTYT